MGVCYSTVDAGGPDSTGRQGLAHLFCSGIRQNPRCYCVFHGPGVTRSSSLWRLSCRRVIGLNPAMLIRKDAQLPSHFPG